MSSDKPCFDLLPGEDVEVLQFTCNICSDIVKNDDLEQHSKDVHGKTDFNVNIIAGWARKDVGGS